MNKDKFLRTLIIITILAVLLGTLWHVGGFALDAFSFIKGTGDKVTSDWEYEGVKEVEAKADLLNITIKKGDSYTVSYDGDKKLEPKVEYDESEGTLSIRQSSSIKRVANMNFHSELTMTIPEGVTLEKMSLEADLGNVIVSDLTCKEMDLDLDLGNFEGRRVTVEELEVDADLGNVELYESSLKDVKVNANLGNVILELTEDVSKYSITTDAAMGNVEIGGVKVKGKTSQSGDLGTLKIVCDMGNITVYTKAE